MEDGEPMVDAGSGGPGAGPLAWGWRFAAAAAGCFAGTVAVWVAFGVAAGWYLVTPSMLGAALKYLLVPTALIAAAIRLRSGWASFFIAMGLALVASSLVQASLLLNALLSL